MSNLPEIVNNKMPETKTGKGGPKGIGVLDKPFVALDPVKLGEALLDAVKILRLVHGDEIFQNDLGAKLRQNFRKLSNSPEGSNIFIASAEVTIAIQKSSSAMMIEIRKPGEPYQRGFMSESQFALNVTGMNMIGSEVTNGR